MLKKAFQILVVDDEVIYAEGIQQILELEGYSVQIVHSGEEALQKLSWKPYHLVITDLMMPGINGMTLLSEVLAMSKHTRDMSISVLLMTAYATVQNAVAAMKTGASGYYVKGSDLTELIKEVDSVYEQMALCPATTESSHAMNEGWADSGTGDVS